MTISSNSGSIVWKSPINFWKLNWSKSPHLRLFSFSCGSDSHGQNSARIADPTLQAHIMPFISVPTTILGSQQSFHLQVCHALFPRTSTSLSSNIHLAVPRTSTELGAASVEILQLPRVHEQSHHGTGRNDDHTLCRVALPQRNMLSGWLSSLMVEGESRLTGLCQTIGGASGSVESFGSIFRHWRPAEKGEEP